MGRYIVRRILQMIPTLLLVTFATYALLLIVPGDPVATVVGQGQQVEPETVQRIRHDLGLDQPIPVQYGKWLWRVLHGDLGRSTFTKQPVLTEIAQKVPVTIQVGLAGWLVSIFIAIPAGIISAVKRNSWIDIMATLFSLGGMAIPGFWLAIMLILVFCIWLGWLPPFGFVSILSDPGQALRLLILPAITIGISITAGNMRQTRAAMLEVLAQDYVRTARAKGLHERTVIWLHVLKNALLPVVTIMGMQLGGLIAGAFIIEMIFVIPGVGRTGVQAIFNKDFPMVQGILLICSLAMLFANLITDLIYAWLDPRIRYQ